jgi:hypothetical protein
VKTGSTPYFYHRFKVMVKAGRATLSLSFIGLIAREQVSGYNGTRQQSYVIYVFQLLGRRYCQEGNPMKPVDHWSKRALGHVRVLAREIGARGATGDGERRAAEYVRDQLHRLGLSGVRFQPFQGATSGWMPWSIAFSLAAWGMLIGLLFGRVGGAVAVALYLLAAWIIYRELHPTVGSISGYPVRRWLWRAESHNVLGVAPPAGTVNQRVVLMSYLDSGRVSSPWKNQHGQRRVGCMIPLLFLSLLLSAGAYLMAAITANVVFYFIALLLLFPQIGALLVTLRIERSPFSPGANNNAAGLGTLLALAERLTETPLTQTEVWLLATGCRETGGDGAVAFLKAHGRALSNATFVALESVGVGERVIYLTGEGALWSTLYPAETLALAARAANRCRESFPISTGRHRSGPTPMGVIVRSGLAGTTINAQPQGSADGDRRHQRNDSFDTVNPETLARVHAFAWELLQELDTGR